MHKALAAWAVRMIDATEATMPSVVADGLRELGMELGAARALYFGFKDGGSTAVVEADWAAPGITSGLGAEYTEAEAGDLFTLLRAGEIVSCSVTGTEPELAALREILRAEELAADLVIPLVERGRLVRAVVFDFVSAPVIHRAEQLEVGARVRELLAAAERRLRSERERLAKERALHHKQKLQSLGTMAGGILHDMNNVFQVVLGLTEMLVEEPSRKLQRAMADNITDAVLRGAELSHRILLFSRQDHRERQTLDVADVLGSLESILRSTVPEDRELRVHVGSNIGTVYMPRVELEQAVINLCNNAVDATRSGQRISVFASSGPDVGQLTLSVSDTGVGMDEEQLNRATEAFFTTKLAGAGTGLGLAMVRRAVEDAGGTVEIESETGRGTTVHLHLPRGSGPSIEARRAPVDVDGSETILLAEDDAMVLRVTASNLRRHGYTVITASHGEQAQALFEEHAGAIDLVVTDVIMPGLGGVELYEAVAAHGTPPPFLFTTGYDAGQLSDGVLTSPERQVLLKPYASHELMQRVRGLLDGAPARDR